MSEDVKGKMREMFERARGVLFVAAPFFASLLANARVMTSEYIDTAAVTDDGVIVLNPWFFSYLDANARVFVLAHEVAHVAFRDPQRRGDRDPEKWNAACDLVINELLMEFFSPGSLRGSILTFSKVLSRFSSWFEEKKVRLEELRKMSKEQVYDLLPEEVKSSTDKMLPVRSRDVRGEVIQEGNPEVYGDDSGEKWKERVAVAYARQKSAGRMPAALERIVKNYLRAKVDWRAMLLRCVRDGVGLSVVQSWKKPGRKSDDAPGLVRMAIPTVWCLVDTSGSMSDEELSQIIGEIAAIAGVAKVKVVCWDAEAYDEVTVRSRGDVPRLTLKGGGGTVILPVLRKVLKTMRNKDVVVVFTDGEISDLNSRETVEALVSVASRAAAAVMVVTRGAEVHLPARWTVIHVE